MTKRSKVLPARKQRNGSRDDESLLMRSAESLGRVIGSLQRQLDGAARRLPATTDDVMGMLSDIPLPGANRGSRKSGATKAAGAKKRTATRAAATRKTAGRKTAGRKTAGRKTAGRKTSATTRTNARKTSKKR
jgi:hypothetical protein